MFNTLDLEVSTCNFTYFFHSLTYLVGICRNLQSISTFSLYSSCFSLSMLKRVVLKTDFLTSLKSYFLCVLWSGIMLKCFLWTSKAKTVATQRKANCRSIYEPDKYIYIYVTFGNHFNHKENTEHLLSISSIKIF